MDLSWCIICDNRIADAVTESSLYCSESCRCKDQGYSVVNAANMDCDQPSNNNNSGSLMKPLRLNKMAPSPMASMSRSSKRNTTNSSSTSYPWELLYTRPRNRRHIIVKRCQPMVASSFTTATALFSPKPSLV